MKMETLKRWRKIIPAVLFVVGYGIFGFITGLWKFPEIDLKNAGFSLVIIPIAFVYYVLGIQKLANSIWHREVTENLRNNLVECAGITDDPEVYTWAAVKRIFYKIIDNDQSLKVQAGLAYDNGLMWTSSADTAIVSLIWMLLSIIFLVIGIPNSEWAILFFLSMMFMALIASILLTIQHKEIGSEQIEIIKIYHKEKLIEGLNRIDSNSNS